MTNNQRILQLLESMLDSESTPEQACADCPELLPIVRQRWKQYQGIEAEVEAMFPASAAEPSHTVKWAPRLCGDLPQIPGYEIRGMLGRGGMGVVYVAQQLSLDRTVALKMLLSGVYASKTELTRFSREARIIAGLKHPHLVQVHDVGESEGCPYFTMELVEGGSLAQLLAGVPQSPSDASKMVATLALAVQAAHDGGIVHRDLKPSNILMTADGIPKIGDFGLARRLEEDADLTLSGARMGTPSYMAPEQITNRTGEVGPLSDVYSLGAILYEMLTGRPPFRADTVADTERQLIANDPVRPSRLNSRVPRDLETVCLKCLQKSPQRRYATAKLLADDLCRFQNGEPISARPVGQIEQAVKWARRRPSQAVLIVGSVALMLGLAVAAVLLISQRTARSNAVAADLQAATGFELQEQWDNARTALLRAKIELGDHGPADLHYRLDENNRNLDLVARLDKIHLNQWTTGDDNPLPVSDVYQSLFTDAGIQVFSPDQKSAEAFIRNSPIRKAFINALDDWVVLMPDLGHLKWIMSVAQASDEDQTAWHRSARDLNVLMDKDAFDKLLASAPIDKQSISLLIALGCRLNTFKEDSVPFFRRVQQRFPDDFWINLALGGALSEEGNNADAIRYLQAAVACRPTAGIAEEHLAMCLYNAGHPDEAFFHFENAIKLEPASEGDRGQLVQQLMHAGRIGEAIEQAQLAVQANPKSAYLRGILAKSFELAGRQKDADMQWSQAFALDPKVASPDRQFNDGRAWGHFVQQWQDLKTSLENDPTDYNKWSGYLELCLFVGMEDDYRSARTRMLALFGKTTSPYVADRTGRACLLFPATEEETRQAVALIDRAVAADKSLSDISAQPYFQFAKGLAEYRQGRFYSAISILQGEASKVLGPSPKLIVAMAQCRLGKIEEAKHSLASAEISRDWSPDHATDPEAWINHVLRRQAEALIRPASAAGNLPFLILASLDNGRYTEAVEQAQLAVKLNPRDAQVHQLLSESLEASGKFDESNAQWHQAFSLDPKLAAEGVRRLFAIKTGGHLEQNWEEWKTALTTNPPEHESWSGYPELCLYLSHEDDYRDVRSRLLARFGDTTDPQTAERTGRACLLLPASEDETQKAVALIDRALAADKTTHPAWMFDYFKAAKGLAEYRQGRFESAIVLLQGDASGVLGPAPNLIVAMAQYRLGKTDAAPQTLATALRMFDWSPGHATDADAWMFHVLRRQAEETIGPSPATSGGP